MPTVAINKKQKIYIYLDGKSKKRLIAAKIEIKNKKKKLILLKYFFKL
jgi:hypothetical protein